VARWPPTALHARLLGFGLDVVDGSLLHPVISDHPLGLLRAARNMSRDALQMATVKEVKGYLFDGMKSLGIIELMEMYH